MILQQNNHPIDLLQMWIQEEKSLGAENAQCAVLSTQGIDGNSHARIMAIREITKEHLLFFTQKRTRKIEEIRNNKKVNLTFWFERHAKEVIIEGDAVFLSPKQNAVYWDSYPKLAQIRFCSYASTSGLPIENKQILENKKQTIEKLSINSSLPCPSDYIGIKVIPKRFVFYHYRLDELSDVFEYLVKDDVVVKTILSP